MFLDSSTISCPYCGESIEILLEPMDLSQQYYEDCQVCCQPILIKVTTNSKEDKPLLRCFRADDTP